VEDGRNPDLPGVFVTNLAPPSRTPGFFVTDHASRPYVTRTRRRRTSRIVHSPSTRPSRPRPQPARAVAETAASLHLRAPASGGRVPFRRSPLAHLLRGFPQRLAQRNPYAGGQGVH